MCVDGEPTESKLMSEWRRARKEHRCYACHETVRVGDRYHVNAGRWDGKVEDIKHCARCWTMGEEIGAMAGCWQYDLACGVSWQDAFEEEPPPHVARLAFLTPDEAQKLVL